MKQTLVIGLGASGKSVAKYLLAQGEAFDLADTRTELAGADWYAEHAPKAKLWLGPLTRQLLSQYRCLVVSPGLSIQQAPFTELTEQDIIGDIELFARHRNRHHAEVPLLAITGSNGKSTVTEWVADMAKRAGLNVAVGGNLGLPALDLLADDVDLYVLELSSFQLETTRTLNATVATVLNVSPDHLDRYDSYQAYIDSKRRLWTMTQCAVINQDDPATWPDQPLASRRFSLNEATDWSLIGQQLCHQQRPVCAQTQLALAGRHNVANALASLAMVESLALDAEACLASVRQFSGLQHRCQWVAERQGAAWYNDSKGTNVGATLAAIQGLSVAGRLLLLAGGDGKGADFYELAPALQAKNAILLAYGLDGDKLCRQLSGIEQYRLPTLAQAVALAHQLVRPGDLVLLSPACASLDQFANYHQRGLAFCQLVESLS